MTDRKRKSIIAFFAILGLFALLHKSGLLEHLTLEAVQRKSAALKAFVAMHYWESVIIYFLVYVVAIALALPIVMPLALLGGYLFYTVPATLYSSVGVLGGILTSYFIIRTFFYSLVERWATTRLARFRRAIDRYGVSYFLVLYLLSIVPSFVLAALAVVAEISVPRFIIVTLLGNLPILFICSLAGRQFATIQAVQDIFSWQVVLSFALLILLVLLPIFVRFYKERLEVDLDS